MCVSLLLASSLRRLSSFTLLLCLLILIWALTNKMHECFLCIECIRTKMFSIALSLAVIAVERNTRSQEQSHVASLLLKRETLTKAS